jgi:hypothetical protein
MDLLLSMHVLNNSSSTSSTSVVRHSISSSSNVVRHGISSSSGSSSSSNVVR